MPYKDPIKRKEYSRQYVQKNKKEHNKKNRKWYRNNTEYYSLYQKEYRKKNKEIIKIKKRDYVLRTTYGISTEEYNKMFKKQNGKCAICNVHQNQLSKVLNVDHCHNTNKIRDLLCDKCNLTVGYVENCNIDDILNYIKKHKEKLN
jgi:hypothetical protein